MRGSLLPVALLFLSLAGSARADEPAADGPHRPVKDELLDKLIGSWRETGTIMGQKAEHQVDARWVLGHQFVELHFLELKPAAGKAPYEAMVYLGYDNLSERYVAHWIDVFGGRYSETLGYGVREGQKIELLFEYPDGPFRTRFEYRPESKGWQLVMRTKNKQGAWEDFARTTLEAKAAKP